MINKSFTVQPAIIQQKKGSHNNSDDFASTISHKVKRGVQSGICATSAINQLNELEKNQANFFSENSSKLEDYSVSDNVGIKRNALKITALESFAVEELPEAEEKCKVSAVIENGALQQADCLKSKDIEWLDFLQDFFKQVPTLASSIDKIRSLQAKAGEVDEIIFLVERSMWNSGYGNLNVFIEFLRNFVRLSPGTLSLIRFSGCEKTLRDKLPNLLSGLPDSDIDDSIIHGDIGHRLSSLGTRPDKIFGIPYKIQPRTPREPLSKNILQIYTVWDYFSVSREAPLFRITNYGWFPFSQSTDFLQNKENHLPVYPYEVGRNISTTELMNREIANSLQTMNPAMYGYDTEKLARFFMELLQLAKENKIYLTLFYHARGMTKYKCYNYATAAKECFSDKPVIIIAPHNERLYLSEKKRKELSDTGKVQFSTNYSLHFTTQKTPKDSVIVFEFDFLPKRLFELVCYFSNIPIYAPGASTANLAQCLNKPYLGSEGHDLPIISKREVSGRWEVVNHAFDFNPFQMQKAKSALLTMSKEQIMLSDRNNYVSWSAPENAHMDLLMICNTITEPILKYRGLIPALLPHFFNGTDASKIHGYPTLTDDDRKSYFTRLVDESRLPDFCQYVCDQSNEIMLDYMSQATKPGGTFYELAKELQQKALHPDNNMMLEVLEKNLSNHSNPSKSPESASSQLRNQPESLSLQGF